MSAATASTSVTSPSGASTTNSALTASEAMTFWRITRAACRAPRSATGSRERSSDISATSADCRAASVPAAPMAIPTGAAASAGASLMPSPTIATGPAARSSSSTHCAQNVHS